MGFKKQVNYTGILVFLITMIVYFFSVERTGSLWDCGEFVLGAYKLEVVHPPGAPLFILIGSIFANVADFLSDDPADVAFAVNLMSGFFSALMAMLVAWTTIILGKLSLVGRAGELTETQKYSVLGGGFVAGLVSAFSISIWFSAVEGEVYAMSTFFTALTVWATFKWYNLPDSKDADRWLLFAVFSISLSTGVHLLSLLAFPIITLLYYYKKFSNHSLVGILVSLAIGVGLIGFLMKGIIAGIPTIWTWFELITVNSFGLPIHSGLVPTLLLIAAFIAFGLWYAKKKNNHIIEILSLSVMLMVIGFSTIGTVVIRANADTPVNMNVPSDAFSLLPYINREQYGERPLLKGPHFEGRPVDYTTEPRYGRVGDKYEIVSEKLTPVYRDKDQIFFPRIGHNDGAHTPLYRMWGAKPNRAPSMGFNLSFFFRYQLSWMYMRYFAWNFIGKQNNEQGYYSWDETKGNWMSGVKFIDDARLFNSDYLPDTLKNNKSRNFYYFLPFIFGIIGFFFHLRRSKKDFFALLMFFLITGVGLIVYSNQPPNEPRERDYVLVGSFITFAMWVGLAVPAIPYFLKEKVKVSKNVLAGVSFVVVLLAPLLMGFQNYDDMSRMGHYASRDYAANFLNSCKKDAIIFTYGDNDTYPLWYAQEVEGIRTDVRVVNLSLLAVDWYINKLRKKVNDSPAIKLSISADSIRGNNRNQMMFYNPNQSKMLQPWPLKNVLKFMAGNHPIRSTRTTFPSYIPTRKMYIPINRDKAINNGWITEADSSKFVSKIEINFDKRNSKGDFTQNSLTKDEIAMLDILANNINDRPIYYSVTVRNEKLLGLNNNTQLEGLGLRVIPVNTGNKSNSLYYSGRVDADMIYENIMTKWKWGNFDKEETFIDESYGPEISAMRMVFSRGAKELLKRGDKERAGKLAKKYFEVFPHYNFPYDYSVLDFIDILISVGEVDEAKKHLDILVNEVDQYMQFFSTIDEDAYSSYKANRETDKVEAALGGILRLLGKIKDDEYKNNVQNTLMKHVQEQRLN